MELLRQMTQNGRLKLYLELK